MIEKICDFCNKTFLVHPYREKIAHFCSYDCYHNLQKKLAYQQKICPFCGKEFTPNAIRDTISIVAKSVVFWDAENIEQKMNKSNG
jgi:hypothetical protein